MKINLYFIRNQKYGTFPLCDLATGRQELSKREELINPLPFFENVAFLLFNMKLIRNIMLQKKSLRNFLYFHREQLRPVSIQNMSTTKRTTTTGKRKKRKKKCARKNVHENDVQAN